MLQILQRCHESSKDGSFRIVVYVRAIMIICYRLALLSLHHNMKFRIYSTTNFTRKEERWNEALECVFDIILPYEVIYCNCSAYENSSHNFNNKP